MEKQAPYLVIGDGRLARHLTYYFRNLGLPFSQWSRSQASKDQASKDYPIKTLEEKTNDCTHVLLAITDDAIEPFIREHKALFQNKVVLHCSGSLHIKEAIDIHPLMTFGPELYECETYKTIGFVTCFADFDKDKHLPGIDNSIYKISPKEKGFYHANCVLAGNFTQLLWGKLQDSFKKLDLPDKLYQPYLEQVFKNLKKSSNQGTNQDLSQNSHKQVLTGPLARKDMKTIKQKFKLFKQ